MVLAFVHMIRNGLRRLIPFNNTDPTPLLPVVAGRQAPGRPRELAICQGTVFLLVMFAVYGAYFITNTAARRLSLTFAPLAFVGVVHIVYLGIYALERCGVIDGDTCDSLIESVENLCPVGNYFTRMPPTIPPWPRRILCFLARSVVRAVLAIEAHEQREEEE